jgi:hypothetical protein
VGFNRLYSVRLGSSGLLLVNKSRVCRENLSRSFVCVSYYNDLPALSDPHRHRHDDYSLLGELSQLTESCQGFRIRYYLCRETPAERSLHRERPLHREMSLHRERSLQRGPSLIPRSPSSSCFPTFSSCF